MATALLESVPKDYRRVVSDAIEQGCLLQRGTGRGELELILPDHQGRVKYKIPRSPRDRRGWLTTIDSLRNLGFTINGKAGTRKAVRIGGLAVAIQHTEQRQEESQVVSAEIPDRPNAPAPPSARKNEAWRCEEVIAWWRNNARLRKLTVREMAHLMTLDDGVIRSAFRVAEARGWIEPTNVRRFSEGDPNGMVGRKRAPEYRLLLGAPEETKPLVVQPTRMLVEPGEQVAPASEVLAAAHARWHDLKAVPADMPDEPTPPDRPDRTDRTLFGLPIKFWTNVLLNIAQELEALDGNR